MIILAHCGNGYCGCDSEEAFFFNNSIDEVEIEEEILSWAQENAESFTYIHFGWDESYTDEEYEDYLEIMLILAGILLLTRNMWNGVKIGIIFS